MRATTVRFGEDLWALLEQEARREGLSAAQYVRDATVLRLAFAMAGQGDPEAEATLADVAAGAARRRQARPRTPHEVVLGDAGRLDALKRTGLLDAAPDPALDRLARMAARILNAPVATVTLIDADRQVFAGCVGLSDELTASRETPLSHSFCQHPVVSREPLVVSDAREDPRVRDNRAIVDMDVIAYAGFPLIDAAGNALGALCVIDHKPRTWTSDQLELLSDLAASAVTELSLRLA